MLRLIVWVVIIILALSFFGVSLKTLVEDPTTQANFSFIINLLESGWDTIVEWLTELKETVLDLAN